jgi:hypothetical protein
MSFQTVDVDEADYNLACKKSTHIYAELTSKLNNISYIRKNINIHPLKFYHFKVTRNDNNSDGIYICLHPNELMNGIQVYNIINNMKDFDNCTYCKNVNDIINHINNNLFKNEQIKFRMNYICFQLKKNNINFKIGLSDDYTVLMYDKNTLNGYIIKFSNDYYAKIGIMNNKKWYEQHKTTCITNSVSEFFSKITEYLSKNLHETPINMIKMCLTRDILSDDDADNYNEIRELHSKHSNYYCDDPM